MEIVESHVEDQNTDVSIARGGPIYVPSHVSPLTGVLEFQDSVVQQLQNLRAEICSDPSQTCEEDLSADELKIFSEEELVQMALKEAFKGGTDAEKCLPASLELPTERTLNNAQIENSVEGKNASTSLELLNGPSRGTSYSERLKCDSKKRKKRGRVPHQNNFAVEKNDMAAVESIVKIKQKQDEDKAAARLHSFNGSCKIDECAITSTEKDEMKFFKSIHSGTKVKSFHNLHMAVSYPEIVLRVEVYLKKKKKICTKTQEFLVLGRQTLAELRDKIYCLTDEVMQKAGQYDPSGYFLIEEVFCSDMRDPAAIDYSKPIFDWLGNSKKEALEKWGCITSGKLQGKHRMMLGDVGAPRLPRFRSSEMQKTRFCDLRFQLGAGYLYCHQGDCRHTVVIRDMRLIHAEDASGRAAYPLTTYQQKLRVRKCSVCRICSATKVTADDKFAPENPCYFCEKCYFLLHYSEDQSLLYSEFSVYDYFHE